MALPVDFWRSEQMLNVFRTKSCNRLMTNGECDWGSQCQFSHNPDWPRRSPQKHRYSPELCPHIRPVPGAAEGEARVENHCRAGDRCPHAHTKEEVLFHPQLLKTSICDEYKNQQAGAPGRNVRGGGRQRCHRYYCPFAHGAQELRSSTLSQEQRERCFRALEILPNDDCCEVCTPHKLSAWQRTQTEAPPASPQDHWSSSPQVQPGQPTQFQGDPRRQHRLSGVSDHQERYTLPYQSGSVVDGQQAGSIMAMRPPWMGDANGYIQGTPGPAHLQGNVVHMQDMQQVMPAMGCANGTSNGSVANTGGTGQPVMHLAPYPGCGMPTPQTGGGSVHVMQVAMQPNGSHGCSMCGPVGNMQVVQVTPVGSPAPPGPAPPGSPPPDAGQVTPRQVYGLIRSAGLDHVLDTLAQSGYHTPEAIVSLTQQDMENLNLQPNDAMRLGNVLDGWRRMNTVQAASGLCMMPMNRNAMTVPFLVGQYPSYQWMPGSPGQPGLSGVAVQWQGHSPQMMPPYALSPAPMQVHQHDGRMFLPQVPPLPVAAQGDQNMQYWNNGRQDVMLAPQPVRTPPPQVQQQLLHQATLQTPPPPPQQQQKVAQSNPGKHASGGRALGGSQHGTGELPGKSDVFLGTPPKAGGAGSRRRQGRGGNGGTAGGVSSGGAGGAGGGQSTTQGVNQRQQVLSRMVERVLEAAEPPVMTIDELQKRLAKQKGPNESMEPFGRLLNHIKAHPEQFQVRGTRVTLMKFAHLPQVKQQFEDEGGASTGR